MKKIIFLIFCFLLMVVPVIAQVPGIGDSGCVAGYDRYGKALGEAIVAMFPDQIQHLAKTKCKGRRRDYKQAPDFYGLFFNSKTQRSWVDGACGDNCMVKILNKIGFSLERIGESERANCGEVFYRLIPIKKHEYKWL